ncbi:TPA: prophage tail fiber N-terminal domain-containing protein [Escherichia coli]|uniref:prophage tail fiber N-terminal domain-containing protein n=1 Tax=Escherichia coli TaxID=562 RepID=UPI001C413E9E|nr:prophage tail fiber N-terminal domain-containing protein [Escherichia coli]QYE49953.1 prophage tail fiber N-terminal domain-containing protein [Escherichia coli O139:H1]HBH7160126.1 prophage tail fiber N-terminal domain-containing protein [Escherichia coli]HBH7183349.1 prophage tail fiber N-terminal domain-containing protein [Escherichia coli]HBH7193149.1 prophage tail fiber N-terminal domain-containing protein [Escherichia coli]HBH7202419.1 prophage tail fiber N-terminal domain-containing 
MSVVISGALIDGAGIPMSGCHIILKSRVNTSEVVMRTVADVVTGNCGEYCFKAQTGKYCVYLKQDWRDEYCVGDIAVYDDSRPGTLNDFLTALDEGDLKPDVVKRFEEMVAQAQQSAEAAAESEQQAGQHVADAQQIKSDCETLADNVQQNAEAVAEDKNQVALLASSATQDAARAEQAVKDADAIVQKAVDKLADAATLTGEAKASAESAAKSEQNAKQHRDEAQRIVDDLKGTNASTTQKGLVQLCSDTDNDSEELAATPKAVKTVMDETKTKAPLDSPAFTGTPTTPTPPDDAAGLETANAAFVRKLLAALVDSSPEALDTLNELAAALGNDPEFATTIMNALAGKQPLSNVLTAISNLEERADNLLCFNQDGNASLSPLSEKARALLVLDTPEAMRTELELKAAATMEAQSDIYDRTAGCLALPGAFGYGHVFSSSEVVYFSAQNGPAEFLKWVFEVTPGRYAVTQYGGSGTSYNPIIAYDMGQPYFRGLVDIDIRYGIDSGGIEAEARRWITFHGDAEYSGGFGEGPAKYQVLVKKSMRPSDLPEAWSRLFWSRNRLMQLLYATENTSKRPPFPGGLVLAAYLPDDGSSEVTLLRAQGVSGSRLRQVVFEAEYRTSGISAAARSFVYGDTLPGTYVALSGGPDVEFYNRGLVSLFVRIA